MSDEKNVHVRNVAFDEFVQLLEEDGLPSEHLETVRKILGEISQKVTEFSPKQGTLLALAEEHSPHYRDLGEEQGFINGVLNMPLFFTN